MQVVDSKRGFGRELRTKLMRIVANMKAKSSDRREYTLMFVPHHGKNVVSLRLPIKALKYMAATLSVLLVLTIGTFVNYRYKVNAASAEKAELERLRVVNATQNNQIEQLAKSTAVLQEDMNRLNRLDAELRRLVNSEDLPASRSGGGRPSSGNNGQGGPIAKPQVKDLNNLVQELQAAAKIREQSLIAAREALVERNARLAATPSVWPTNGDVTSRFGWRGSPWGGWGSDWHPGIDIANDYGTPIVATADGVVVYSEWYSGYGNMVQIDHGYGITTIYAHNSRNVVSAGARIKKGEVVAYMGSTGYSTGNHVHYEVRVNETAVNPANYL